MTRYLSNEQRADQHMDRHSDSGQEPARILRVVLTDKSIAYNVVATLEGQEFVLACQDREHAVTLSDAINQASWIERS